MHWNGISDLLTLRPAWYGRPLYTAGDPGSEAFQQDRLEKLERQVLLNTYNLLGQI